MGKKQKVIFHMDGDSFFVGCEVAKNPKLKGLPVVTGEERGIASALSYEAKALGLIRGTPIYKIKRDFPQVIVLPGDYKSYAKFSKRMFDIVRRYADEVEEYSIDECFADLTGLDKPLYMTYAEIAQRIKQEVTEELGLSVSVGVGLTKCLAKVASKWVKPDGFTIIERDKINDFLSKTPIEKIWGIGWRTSAVLKYKGINTALDFVRRDISWIRENLSSPFEVIWQELSGVSVMSVNSESKTSYSSIQKTRTFSPPTNDKTFLLSQLSKNMEEACAKARYYKLVPKIVSFFIKTQSFKYFSFSIPLKTPSNSPEILFPQVKNHFHKVYRKDFVYRTTGLTLHELTPTSASQMDLFGGSIEAHKFEVIHEQIDKLDEKFGKKMVYLASTHQALKRKVKGTDPDDLNRNLLFL